MSESRPRRRTKLMRVMLLLLCVLGSTVIGGGTGCVDDVTCGVLAAGSYLAGIRTILICDGTRPGVFLWTVALAWPGVVCGYIMVAIYALVADWRWRRTRARRAVWRPRREPAPVTTLPHAKITAMGSRTAGVHKIQRRSYGEDLAGLADEIEAERTTMQDTKG